MNMQVLDARRDTSGGYKVDVGRGERVGRVSSEWFSRPADERYLSLSELAHTVRDRTERSRTRVVESALKGGDGLIEQTKDVVFAGHVRLNGKRTAASPF